MAPTPGKTALASAIDGALGPLRFATRDRFSHLARLVEPEATIRSALGRLAAQVTSDEDMDLMKQVEASWSNRLTPLRQRLHDVLAALEARFAPQDQTEPKTRNSLSRPPQTAPAQRPPTTKKVEEKKREETYHSRPASTSPPLFFHSPLTSLKGVGPRVAEQLATRGLTTVGELLRFLPRRYQGRNSYQAIGAVVADEVVSLEGSIEAVADRFVRGRHTLEVTLADVTGQISLMWFRVPHRHFVAGFKRGARLRAAGTVKRFRNRLQINHPEVGAVHDGGGGALAEPSSDDDSDLDAVIPIYLDIDGVHPSQLRRIMAQALRVPLASFDPLPDKWRQKRGFLPLQEALRLVHRPAADQELDALQRMQTPQQKRLIYDELLLLQLHVLQQRQNHSQAHRSEAMKHDQSMIDLARRLFPFVLTQAQTRVLGHVERDLSLTRPMQRLLQGDVGSGKTAVALTAAARVALLGRQVALMAPTELLAEQHARSAQKFLEAVDICVRVLTARTPPRVRRETLAMLAAGRPMVLVGTHAIIQQDIQFGCLGLAIIDEQHRFGVAQRARLLELGRGGSGFVPHTLVMTATPIPRTLALTAYGELDVSVIDELPPGRTPITTKVFRDGDRAAVYRAVREHVALGRQAYVVFPLVEESDKEGVSELRAATSSIEELSAGPLKNLRLGLLHGRLPTVAKEAVMQAFLRQEMDVLVATTVIEVGIDVPNASVMVVEHAERFGLSQLHQLRGRVGRGSAASYCFLVARARPQTDSWRRLMMMAESNDGFRIAEEDLAMRGPGDVLGTRQSGLPVLAVANLARDGVLLEAAHEDARSILAEAPGLLGPQWQGLREQLARAHASGARDLSAG